MTGRHRNRGERPVARRLLSPNEAARYLGVSRRTVYFLMADGSLSFVQVGQRRRLDLDELDRFIEANRRRLGRRATP